MPYTDDEEERRKRQRLSFTDLLRRQSNINFSTPAQEGFIQTSNEIRPFAAPDTVGNPVTQEEMAATRANWPANEETATIVNYPYASGQNREAVANIAQRYNPGANFVSTIRNNPPMPDVWMGGVYTPGEVSTPEEQEFYKRQSDIGLAGAITKSVPIYDSKGRQIGVREVPDTEARAKALIETPARIEAAAEKLRQGEEKLKQGEEGLTLKQLIAENKLQPYGYGQMINPITGKITKVPVEPKQANQLTMTDVKSGQTMALNAIKNRIMVDATPEEQLNLANQPGENIAALLLSGRVGRALSPDKKQAYIKEINGINDYYGQLERQVMGRKGAALPAQAKQLDENTARAILKEAGGDRDKARKIARQRGYSF